MTAMFFKQLALLGSLFAALYVIDATAGHQQISEPPRVAIVSDKDAAGEPEPEKERVGPDHDKHKPPCIERVREQQRDIADKLHDIKDMLKAKAKQPQKSSKK